MTITTTTIKNSYSGDGTNDTFAYTFKISADADIEVIIRSAAGTETVKTLTTHYTVTGAGTASGGNVVFTAGNIPTATETVVLRRSTTQTQTLDLVENDPFTANSVEGAFDKNLSITQELQEQVDRCIKISRTNTMTSTDFTNSATDRADKILAFDTNGEISVTQELGTYRGDWSASTAYNARDLVKDTSTNNIFLCNTSHTSSGSEPLTTNTDSAKWDLIVDAASATTSATSAAASATAAAASATTATTQASNASTSATNAATSATAAASSATAAASSATAAAASATSAAASYDDFDDTYLGAKSSAPSVDNDGDALATGALYFDTTSNNLNVWNGSSWDAIAADTDVKVAVSSNDTTAGFLNGKLVAGDGIDLTENSDGGNETLTVAVEPEVVQKDVQTTFTKSQVASTETATISTTKTLDFDTYQNFILTLGSGANTLANPTTEASQIGQTGVMILIQPSSGSAGTISLGTDYETVGGAGLTLSSTNSAYDIVPYVVKADNSILIGSPQLAFS